MKHLRTPRRIVAGLGIAFLGVVVAAWILRPAREDGGPALPIPKLGDLPDLFRQRPSLLSTGFIFVGTEDGKPLYRVAAAELVGFEEGWIVLRGVRLTLFDPAGQADTLEGREARVHRERKAGELIGDVRLLGADGSIVSAPRVVFDARTRVAEFPESVEAAWGGVALTAGSARVETVGRKLSLGGGVRMTLPIGVGGSEEKAIHLFADRARVDRAAGQAEATGQVRVLGDPAWISADRLELDLDPQGKPSRFRLDGSPRGLLGSDAVPGAETAGAGRRTVFAADRLLGALSPGDRMLSSLRLEGNAGSTRLLDRAPAEPVRQLVCATLDVAFAAGRASTAEASGGVDLVEQPVGLSRRRMVCDRVRADWGGGKGGSDEPARVEALGSVSLEEGERRAEGNRLVDRGGGEETLLEGAPAAWSDARTILSAARIAFRRAGQAVTAEGGEVHGRLLPDPKGASGPFQDPGQPLFWSCDRFEASGSARTATLVGRARAWQGERLLKADRIQVVDSDRSVVAEGRVRAFVPESDAAREPGGGRAGGRGKPARGGGDGRPGATWASADRLVYREPEATVELLGQASLVNESRRLAADRLLFCLTPERALERVIGEGNVKLSDPADGRKGEAGGLDYRVAGRVLVLEAAAGAPAWVEERGRNRVSGQTIVVEGEGNRIRVLAGEGGRTTSRLSAEGQER